MYLTPLANFSSTTPGLSKFNKSARYLEVSSDSSIIFYAPLCVVAKIMLAYSIAFGFSNASCERPKVK